MNKESLEDKTLTSFALPYAGIIQVRFKGFISPEDIRLQDP